MANRKPPLHFLASHCFQNKNRTLPTSTGPCGVRPRLPPWPRPGPHTLTLTRLCACTPTGDSARGGRGAWSPGHAVRAEPPFGWGCICQQQVRVLFTQQEGAPGQRQLWHRRSQTTSSCFCSPSAGASNRFRSSPCLWPCRTCTAVLHLTPSHLHLSA